MKELEHTAPGHPSTSLQKAYLQRFLLSGASCLTTRKTTGTPKSKMQNNVKRQTKHASEPDMAGMLK